MSKYYLGIDTSAYTTSLAVVDDKSNIIFDRRQILKVKKGSRGLRQHDAVFQHLKNLPSMIEKMVDTINIEKIVGVAVSSKPRNKKNSYMPVFVVGKGQAYIISKLLNIPYKEFSHQEGHIGSGIISGDFKGKEKFLVFHLSGGTTELLLVENKRDNLYISIVGGSLDISVGQLIDRIGVKLGYSFPCGKKLDEMGVQGNIIPKKTPISVRGSWANFSGLENYFTRFIDEKKYEQKHIIKTMFYSIGLFLENIILNYCEKEEIEDILFVGGASSNSFFRDYLSKKLLKNNINAYFPDKDVCTDNSIGIAYLGKIKEGHFIGG